MKLAALSLILAATALLLSSGLAHAAIRHDTGARIFCTSINPPNPAWCP